MSLRFLIGLITSWEVLFVSGVMMILIPLVTYVASVRSRPSRRRFISPADRGLTETPQRSSES